MCTCLGLSHSGGFPLFLIRVDKVKSGLLVKYISGYSMLQGSSFGCSAGITHHHLVRQAIGLTSVCHNLGPSSCQSWAVLLSLWQMFPN